MRRLTAALAALALITVPAVPASAGVIWGGPGQQTCVTNNEQLYPVTSSGGAAYDFDQDGYNTGPGTEESCYDSTTFPWGCAPWRG